MIDDSVVARALEALILHPVDRPDFHDEDNEEGFIELWRSLRTFRDQFVDQMPSDGPRIFTDGLRVVLRSVKDHQRSPGDRNYLTFAVAFMHLASRR